VFEYRKQCLLGKYVVVPNVNNDSIAYIQQQRTVATYDQRVVLLSHKR